MTRNVRRLSPAASPSDPQEPAPFLDFLHEPNLIVLGNPGAGKTHLFKTTAGKTGGLYLKARTFLSLPPDRLKGKELYIDALDEQRAGRGDKGTIDRIVEKLFASEPEKVRISCREIDWLGNSDLAALAPYLAQQGGATVLRLEPLNEDEKVAVLRGIASEGDNVEEFVAEARVRGLSDFLLNPQNLIMLWQAVKAGTWPKNLSELYAMATDILLQEHNIEHASVGAGVFTPDELRLAAGAVCAAGLIGDIDGISVTEQGGDDVVPGYRSMTLMPQTQVQAALGRRVFDAAEPLETVHYAHPTTAAYLAANFLAHQIRNGLPIGRVTALMGVDGKPATELRGLHAWLTVNLPEYADQLISADPYGILTYGDVNALPTSSVSKLVHALDKLSRENPWFRSGDWETQSAGALSRQAIVPEFRAILNSSESNFGVRSIVLEAMTFGQPLPDMIPDLQIILQASGLVFAERQQALEALFHVGEAAEEAVRVAASTMGNTESDLRLRAQILRQLYGKPYGVPDVLQFMTDLAKSSQSNMIGIAWRLADAVPTEDIPALLDSIAYPPANHRRSADEVGAIYARLMVRGWSQPAGNDAERALRWLATRHAFRGSQSVAKDLRPEMRKTAHRFRPMADHFFSALTDTNTAWSRLREFQEMTLSEIPDRMLIEAALAALPNEAVPRRAMLYDMVLSLSFRLPPSDRSIFEHIYSLADGDTELEAAREQRSFVTLPDNYFPNATGRRTDKNQGIAKDRKAFDTDIDVIQAGGHLGWLQHLGRLYFGMYSDVRRDATPHERLSDYLGPERLASALEAIRASLRRNDLPTYADVARLIPERRQYDWWYAILAALDEIWESGDDLSMLSDDFAKAILAFSLVTPVPRVSDGVEQWREPAWRVALINRFPAVARDAYLDVARIRLAERANTVEGLNELLTDDAFAPNRGNLVIDLLRDFPNCDDFSLRKLLAAASSLPSTQTEFGALAADAITGTVSLEPLQADRWLAAAYLWAPKTYQAQFEVRARADRNLMFVLRSQIGILREATPSYQLPQDSLEFIIQLLGELFPNVSHPTGGWSGDTNPWDASEYFSFLVGTLSAVPTAAATQSLERLVADPHLVSYKSLLQRSLGEQRRVRLDVEYDRPTWFQAVQALSNKAPATVSDFHALLSAYLRDFRHEIAHGNTDIWKMFWNVDQYSRAEEPRPEEACRDALVTLLRQRLAPLGIQMEPEGHMAGDKRADISAVMPGKKILCELKRDYHADLWTAMEGQLERFYAHDPESKGLGFYIVFWFGDKRPTSIPKAPRGMEPPTSAQDLEAKLLSILPPEMAARLKVIVIDVSGDR